MTQSFSDIWEQEARWLSGPGLLGAIIEHLRNKAPEIVLDAYDPNIVNLIIPMPTVEDAISKDGVSIARFIPEELMHIFECQCALIINDWVDSISYAVLKRVLGQQITKLSLYDINSELAGIENCRRAAGDDELWVIAAHRFGFRRLAVPNPIQFGSVKL